MSKLRDKLLKVQTLLSEAEALYRELRQESLLDNKDDVVDLQISIRNLSSSLDYMTSLEYNCVEPEIQEIKVDIYQNKRFLGYYVEMIRKLIFKLVDDVYEVYAKLSVDGTVLKLTSDDKVYASKLSMSIIDNDEEFEKLVVMNNKK